MYVTAGATPDYTIYNNVYHYNTNTDQWTVLPQPGHYFGVLHMLDDKLTIFGGQDPITIYKQWLNKVTTYNNDTNSWYSRYPEMLNKRFRPGVITCHNYVIVMGGGNSPGTYHDSIEVMDYHDELQWKEISVHLPVPMWRIKPTISGDNIIVGYSTGASRSNEHYQITIDEIISSLEQPLSTGTLSTKWKEMLHATHYDTVTVPYSNPPMVIGGSDVNSVPTAEINLYDPLKCLWTNVDALTCERQHVAIALLNSSTIIIIGGTGTGGCIDGAMASSLTTVEIGNIVLNH